MHKLTPDQLYKLATECLDPTPTLTPELWRTWQQAGLSVICTFVVLNIPEAQAVGPLRVTKYIPRRF